MKLIFPITMLLFPLLTYATKNYHGCTWDRPNFRKCSTLPFPKPPYPPLHTCTQIESYKTNLPPSPLRNRK